MWRDEFVEFGRVGRHLLHVSAHLVGNAIERSKDEVLLPETHLLDVAFLHQREVLEVMDKAHHLLHLLRPKCRVVLAKFDDIVEHIRHRTQLLDVLLHIRPQFVRLQKMILIRRLVKEVVQQILDALVANQTLIEFLCHSTTGTIKGERRFCIFRHIQFRFLRGFHRFMDAEELSVLAMLVCIVVEGDASLIEHTEDKCLIQMLHREINALDGVVLRQSQNMHHGSQHSTRTEQVALLRKLSPVRQFVPFLTAHQLGQVGKTLLLPFLEGDV